MVRTRTDGQKERTRIKDLLFGGWGYRTCDVVETLVTSNKMTTITTRNDRFRVTLLMIDCVHGTSCLSCSHDLENT